MCVCLDGEVLDVMGDNVQRNVTGSRKVKVLASVLQGRLERRKATRRLGGSGKGKEVFAAVCELLPRSSSDSEPDIDELKKKAQEKGWARDYVPLKWSHLAPTTNVWPWMVSQVLVPLGKPTRIRKRYGKCPCW